MSKSHGEKIQNYLVGGLAAAAAFGALVSLKRGRRDDHKEAEQEATDDETYSSTLVSDVQLATVAGPYDVILVMGGGRPKDARTPPVWVQRRLDAAAQVYNHYHEKLDGRKDTRILAVNGLSSHVVCPLNDKGLPVRHSGAAAQYLVRTRGIEPENIFMETTSYDTIGGAFFSRVQFSEIRGWRRLLVITCEWHVERVKEVFDWIFSAPHESSQRPYNITFLGLHDTGLNKYVLQARQEKEKKSLANVKELREKYSSLIEIQDFLCLEHDMYAAKRLCSDVWPNPPTGSISKEVKVSYGMSPNITPDASTRNAASPHTPSSQPLGAWSLLRGFG